MTSAVLSTHVEAKLASHDFFGLGRHELEAMCVERGVSARHARTLLRSAYRHGKLPPWTHDAGLPRTLARWLESNLCCGLPVVRDALRSEHDATVKFRLGLRDGAAIETVLMPERKRITLCVSSQVGCAQGCVFCHTARMGLVRNLSAGEIVAQVQHANRWIGEHPDWSARVGLPATQRIGNVVFMGMGEPLDNVAAVVRAIRVLTDDCGLAIAARRITVSTAGHRDGIEALAESCPEVGLALSVHAVDERLRGRLMPISRRWSLASVTEALRPLVASGRRPLMVQYTLIRAVNDSAEHARELLGWIRGLGPTAQVKVNVIPFNEIEVAGLRVPGDDAVAAFQHVLHDGGLRVMVRHSKGRDVRGACGQLVAASSPGAVAEASR